MQLIKNFGDWTGVNEALLLENAPKEVNFQFNFESGEYKREKIPATDLAKLQSEIRTGILGELRVPKTLDGKTTIELEASTSTLGLSATLAAQLQAEGYAGRGNVALCNARMKTVEAIMLELFMAQLKVDEAAVRSKVSFKYVNRANQGSGTTDEERKQWQYIKARVIQTGTPIPPERRIQCGKTRPPFAGVQGLAANNYVGYGQAENQSVYLVTAANMQIKLSFNPLVIPDCFYVKYGDQEFLSPFLGRPTDSRQGTTVDYLAKLNEIPDLLQRMDAELAAVGAKGTALQLQPALVDSTGKIQILPGPEQGNQSSGVHSFTVTKQYTLDKLVIRVFSPLSGTRFNITSSCIWNGKPWP